MEGAMSTTGADNGRLHRESLEIHYNQRNLDGLLSLYTNETKFIDYALGQSLSGPDEIRQYIIKQWEPASSDEVRVTNLIDAGEWTIAQFVNTGVNDGPYGGLEASGLPFEVRFCNIVRWRDGRIIEDHLYYDLYGVLAQLGHADPVAVAAD
jgi:steroid delta-isomerase-like uncharacterized protein